MGTFSAVGDVSLVLQVQPDASLTTVLTATATHDWAVLLEEIVGNASAFKTVTTYSADTAGATVVNDSPRPKRYRLRVATLTDGDTVAYTFSGTAASGSASLDTADEMAAAIATLQSQVATLTTTVAALAPLASPAFTGNPTATTQTLGNNSTRLATTAFVTAAIAAIP